MRRKLVLIMWLGRYHRYHCQQSTAMIELTLSLSYTHIIMMRCADGVVTFNNNKNKSTMWCIKRWLSVMLFFVPLT